MSITIIVLAITRHCDDLHCNTQVGALLHQDLNIKSGKLQLQVLEYFFSVTRTIIEHGTGNTSYLNTTSTVSFPSLARANHENV